MRGSEDELRRPVAPRADVRQIGLAWFDNLGRPEITNDCIFALQEDVMWFDVSVAYSTRVNVQQPPEDLV